MTISKVRKASGSHHDPKPISAEIETLQIYNEKLELKIKKERLLWILVIFILVDFAFFKDFQTWGAPVMIGILEMLIVLLAAHHWGLEQLIALLHDVLKTFKKIH